MTEREKIIKIIAPYVSAYGEDEAIANALIAAGDDMSDIRSLADNVMLSVIAHKAEVSSMEQRAKDAEHRAEVAERALHNCCFNMIYAPFGVVVRPTVDELYKAHLERAKKELQEERKDEQSIAD